MHVLVEQRLIEMGERSAVGVHGEVGLKADAVVHRQPSMHFPGVLGIEPDVVIAVIPAAVIALEKSRISAASRCAAQKKVGQPMARHRPVESKRGGRVERRVEACRTQKIASSESKMMRSF